MAATIGVRAGKFFGVRKIFARISNLPKKFLDHFMCENFLMKTVLVPFRQFKAPWAPFFQIKRCWAPFLLVFSGSLPRFSGIFAKVFTDFDQISPDFARISRGFAQIFTKPKLLGVRLHPLRPRLLHHWPQLITYSGVPNKILRTHPFVTMPT